MNLLVTEMVEANFQKTVGPFHQAFRLFSIIPLGLSSGALE